MTELNSPALSDQEGAGGGVLEADGGPRGRGSVDDGAVGQSGASLRRESMIWAWSRPINLQDGATPGGAGVAGEELRRD
jgi:hypothetical protein